MPRASVGLRGASLVEKRCSQFIPSGRRGTESGTVGITCVSRGTPSCAAGATRARSRAARAPLGRPSEALVRPRDAPGRPRESLAPLREALAAPRGLRGRLRAPFVIPIRRLDIPREPVAAPSRGSARREARSLHRASRSARRARCPLRRASRSPLSPSGSARRESRSLDPESRSLDPESRLLDRESLSVRLGSLKSGDGRQVFAARPALRIVALVLDPAGADSVREHRRTARAAEPGGGVVLRVAARAGHSTHGRRGRRIVIVIGRCRWPVALEYHRALVRLLYAAKHPVERQADRPRGRAKPQRFSDARTKRR
jgi:hypothetical protein